MKLQDAEYGEVKKKRREDRMVIRKKEQRVYEEESVRPLFCFCYDWS